MFEYSKVNVKLTDTQLKKLKTAVKNKTGTTLRKSLKILDGNNLSHELLLTTRQKIKLRNAFINNMSTDLKLSKTQISKILQSGGFLGLLLSKLVGQLMKVAAPLAKNILAPLRTTAAASAIDAGIQRKIHGSGTTTLIISNKEMNDIIKIIQALEDSNILLKGVTKTIKNETKEQKGGFLSMLLGTLVACLLGNILAGKGIERAGYGKEWDPHPLTNFEIQKYYQNQPRFNGVYCRNNLPKIIKDGAYVINLDEYADVGTHWIALLCSRSEFFYFDSFGVEQVLEEIKEFIGNKNIITNIFRVEANNSMMCRYFCMGFIDFMLAGKKLTGFTNSFSPYDFNKNDDIILSYFKDE